MVKPTLNIFYRVCVKKGTSESLVVELISKKNSDGLTLLVMVLCAHWYL